MKTFSDFPVNNASLRSGFLTAEVYRQAHQKLVIFCHDVFIAFPQGILLVKRLNEPAKNYWWTIGGRVLRGYSVEESLKVKTREEAGIDISHIQILDFARTIFPDDPFQHGSGTDTINAVCYASCADGKPSLDDLHEQPAYINPQNRKDFGTLHPYLDHYLDWIFGKLWD